MNKQGSVSVDDDDKDCACGSTSSDSDAYAEATDLPSPTKLLSNLREDSVFITSELYEFLQSSIPNLVKGCQWVLLYSTLKHGISLRTLIRKSADLSGPCLLVVGDRQGAVFGGLLECPLKPTPKRKYQGTNQTFVFTTIYGEPRLFRPTGANRYYYMCLNDLLAFGGGGNFALCLDGDLLSGTSGACDTFGNLCLAHNEDFELKNVEVFGDGRLTV
ncbi:TLDc domain-containing protein [Citrus sinensis]|nr:TLDc domain-containing protein [Citrus sinensis]